MSCDGAPDAVFFQMMLILGAWQMLEFSLFLLAHGHTVKTSVRTAGEKSVYVLNVWLK